MIKNQAILLAANAGMAGPSAEGPLSFLFARQHVTQLTAINPAVCAGYIWRKVFLRSRKGM